MSSVFPLNNEIRRAEKRVFGKDLTNLNGEKIEKFHSKVNKGLLQLKYIPNVKPFQPKSKSQEPIYSDAINQYKQ